MRVIDIDVIGLQALETVIASGDDVFWAQAGAGGKLGDLGSDHELAAIL